MTRIHIAAVSLVVLAAACGGGSSPSSCDEFAGDVRAMINREASADELNRFIEDTQEQVARLIQDDPDHAGPCVEAALEAVFVAGFAELEGLFDE